MRVPVISLISLILTASLTGQSIPTDQVVYPSAEILPALNINLQGGYVNLVGRDGWRQAVRLGIADIAEFEWTRLGFYTDLTGKRQTIPTAGIKVRLPGTLRYVGVSLALYNAQQWDYHPAARYEDGRYNASFDNYSRLADAGHHLQQIDFESIYSRLDVLTTIHLSEKLHLHPSAYYLESKSRNLDVIWVEEDSLDNPDYFRSTFTNEGQQKNWLTGYALGLTYELNDQLTYLAQWVVQPQYHFNYDAKSLELQHRNVWVAGVRYLLLSPIVLDVGLFNDEFEGSLSDVQIYAMLNAVIDVRAILARWRGLREATR